MIPKEPFVFEFDDTLIQDIIPSIGFNNLILDIGSIHNLCQTDTEAHESNHRNHVVVHLPSSIHQTSRSHGILFKNCNILGFEEIINDIIDALSILLFCIDRITRLDIISNQESLICIIGRRNGFLTILREYLVILLQKIGSIEDKPISIDGAFGNILSQVIIVQRSICTLIFHLTATDSHLESRSILRIQNILLDDLRFLIDLHAATLHDNLIIPSNELHFIGTRFENRKNQHLILNHLLITTQEDITILQEDRYIKGNDMGMPIFIRHGVSIRFLHIHEIGRIFHFFLLDKERIICLSKTSNRFIDISLKSGFIVLLIEILSLRLLDGRIHRIDIRCKICRRNDFLLHFLHSLIHDRILCIHKRANTSRGLFIKVRFEFGDQYLLFHSLFSCINDIFFGSILIRIIDN